MLVLLEVEYGARHEKQDECLFCRDHFDHIDHANHADQSPCQPYLYILKILFQIDGITTESEHFWNNQYRQDCSDN